MCINLCIGPYKVIQRTEFSKIKIFKNDKNISDTEDGKNIATKIIKDYFEQLKNRNKYFEINKGILESSYRDISQDGIKFLFVPDDVTRINGSSLRSKDFEYICFPNSLKEIDDNALRNCRELKEIEIPDSVISIGSNVFEDCVNLKKVKLSNNINKISIGMFVRCESLEDIEIPDSVDVIDIAAFWYCSALKNIKLPKFLKRIENNGFEDCENLKEITLPETLTYIGDDAFSGCSSLKNIIIPNNVNTIGGGALYSCNRLEEIKLSENINTLEDFTFGCCYSLENINFPDSIKTIKHNIFYGSSRLRNINIPKNLNEMIGIFCEENSIRSLTFNYDLKEINFKEFDVSIREYDLLTNSNIDKLIISKNVKEITPEAFKYSGKQITEIDYLGTKKEFKEFKNNNKKLFDLFKNLQKVNFIEEKEKENIKIDVMERF